MIETSLILHEHVTNESIFFFGGGGKLLVWLLTNIPYSRIKVVMVSQNQNKPHAIECTATFVGSAILCIIEMRKTSPNRPAEDMT